MSERRAADERGVEPRRPDEGPVTVSIGPERDPAPVVVELADPVVVDARQAHDAEEAPRRGPAGAVAAVVEAEPAAGPAPGRALRAPPEEDSGDPVYVVRLEQFAGPLDLLLHLIREQDIDILDIPVGRITEQFLAAIEGIETRELDNAGDFLEMAATLVRIKARMLLPRSSAGDELEADPRYELVRRLLEYEHFREVARRMEAAEAERARHYARGYVPPPPPPAVPDELPVEWDEVWQAALALAGREREIRQHRVARRGVPVDHKMRVILGALRRIRRVEFRDLVAPFRDRLHAVVTLLAGLELARGQRISIRQRTPFSPLWFFGGERLEDDPESDGGGVDGGGADAATGAARQAPPTRDAGEART